MSLLILSSLLLLILVIVDIVIVVIVVIVDNWQCFVCILFRTLFCIFMCFAEHLICSCFVFCFVLGFGVALLFPSCVCIYSVVVLDVVVVVAVVVAVVIVGGGAFYRFGIIQSCLQSIQTTTTIISLTITNNKNQQTKQLLTGTRE